MRDELAQDAETREKDEVEDWSEARSTEAKAKASRKKRGGAEKREDTPSTAEPEAKRPAVADTTTLPTPSASPTPMPAPRPLALLVCSIGNPGAQYANTLHSAGHTVINHLASRLGHSNFQKDRSMGNGLVSRGPYASPGVPGDWTLWQSTSYMNVSGKDVRNAWTAWSKDYADDRARLVVLHDELEKPLGNVSLKTTQGASAKGHNGLKSIMSVIGKTPFMRIGIGIGRPESRTSDDVARYVLKKMTAMEKTRVEDSVDEVIQKLRELEQG